MVRVAAAVFISLALGALPAFAQGEDLCPSFGQLAENIMRARQSGTVMSTAMGAIPADNPLRELAVSLVKEAYGTPQFNLEDNRQQAVVDFRNKTELACYTNGD